MTEADRKIRETVIEFASCLYGGAWRERLAEVSGMPKRVVADYFRFGKTIPRELSLSMLRAIQNDAEAQIAEKQALCERIKSLRTNVTTKPSDVENTTINVVGDLRLLASTKTFQAEDVPDHTLDGVKSVTKARPHIRSSRIKQRAPLRLVVSRNN